MTGPAEAIRATLDEVKAFLAQEAPPRLSKADTKAYFVEPVLRALAWEGLGVVTREYYVPNSQQFIDYVLRGPSGLLMTIETKRTQEDAATNYLLRKSLPGYPCHCECCVQHTLTA